MSKYAKGALFYGYNSKEVEVWLNELNTILGKAKNASDDLYLARSYSFYSKIDTHLNISLLGGYDKDEVDTIVARLTSQIYNEQTKIRNLLRENGEKY